MATQYDVISATYHNSWPALARTCPVKCCCQLLPAKQEHVYMYDVSTQLPHT